jgi:hypothetical protein
MYTGQFLLFSIHYLSSFVHASFMHVFSPYLTFFTFRSFDLTAILQYYAFITFCIPNLICNSFRRSILSSFHPSTCSPFHLFVLSSIHPFICSSFQLFSFHVHTFISVHTAICSLFHMLTRFSTTYPFICSPFFSPPSSFPLSLFILYPFTCSSFHLFITSSVHSFICTSCYLLIFRLFIISSVHYFTCSSFHLFIISSVHNYSISSTFLYFYPFNCSPTFRLLVFSSAHSLTCAYIHLFILSLVHPFVCARPHVRTDCYYFVGRSTGRWRSWSSSPTPTLSNSTRQATSSSTLSLPLVYSCNWRKRDTWPVSWTVHHISPVVGLCSPILYCTVANKLSG